MLTFNYGFYLPTRRTPVAVARVWSMHPTYMGKPCSNYVSGLRPTALLLTGGVRPSVGGVSPVFRGLKRFLAILSY